MAYFCDISDARYCCLNAPEWFMFLLSFIKLNTKPNATPNNNQINLCPQYFYIVSSLAHPIIVLGEASQMRR